MTKLSKAVFHAANAERVSHLIEASPAMYAALKRIRKICYASEARRTDILRCIEISERAILKAETGK